MPRMECDMKTLCKFGIAILCLCVGAPGAFAEEQWPPQQTVHIIVPFAAGGLGDIVARLLAQHIADKTKRTIIVAPRPGGGTVIGTRVAAVAPADGTTLLLVANTFLINTHVQKKLPYDALTSFGPICLFARFPQLLVVHAKSDYRSLAQFIAAGR